MESRIIKVFYDNLGYPFKDENRSVRFPIVGNAFLGASNTTEIRFYTKNIGGISNEWCVIGKLPNGKKGFKILGSATYDNELEEYYYSFYLSNFFTQYKGSLFLSLGGYNGSLVNLTQEDEYELNAIQVETTGAIKLEIMYSTQVSGSEEEIDTWQEFLSRLSEKLDITNGIISVETLTSLVATNFEENQLLFAKDEYKFYEVKSGSFVLYYDLNEYRDQVGLVNISGTLEKNTIYYLSAKNVIEKNKPYAMVLYNGHIFLYEYDGGTGNLGGFKGYTRHRVYQTGGEKTEYIYKIMISLSNSLYMYDDETIVTYTKSGADSTFASLSGNNTFYGTNTFQNYLPQSPKTPSNALDLTTKNYVDTQYTYLNNRITANADNFDNYVALSQKGSANGVATLDLNGKIPLNQLPDSITGQLVNGGTLLVANATEETEYNLNNCGVVMITDNAVSLLGLTPVQTITVNGITCTGTNMVSYADLATAMFNNPKAVGIFLIAGYRKSSSGYVTVDRHNFVNVTFKAGYNTVCSNVSTGDWLVKNSAGSAGWGIIDNTDAVSSVNGKTGAVVLTGNDIEMGGDNHTKLDVEIDKKIDETEANDIFQTKIIAFPLLNIPTTSWTQDSDTGLWYYTTSVSSSDLFIGANDKYFLGGNDKTSSNELRENSINVDDIVTSGDTTTISLVSKFQPSIVLNVSIVVAKTTPSTQVGVTYLTTDDIDDDTIKMVNSKLKVNTNVVQEKLTFDNAPTQNSTNPVTSGGTFTAMTNLLTPNASGNTTSVADIDGNGNAGFSFNIGSTDNNGFYIFTYGYNMILLPVYNANPLVEYKVPAILVDGNGSYASKILSYQLDNSGNLLIYEKQNYIPVGFVGYLFKIKLY